MSADALLSIVAGRDTTGLIEVRCLVPGAGAGPREWFPIGDRAACIRYMESKAKRFDVYVGTAPRFKRSGGVDAIRRWWCLWADIDTPAALERLGKFTPQPSLIVRSGSGNNCHAYWALSEPLSLGWFRRANDRLIYVLGADTKVMDAARILRPPGTLNWKYLPPVMVTVEHVGSSRPVSVARVVGHLPDPPIARPESRSPRPSAVTDDPLAGISAERYYMTLTGRDISGGNVRCPFHADGAERSPSMRLYDTTWACFACPPQGNGKFAGGTIFEFAARLWGLSTRGDDFVELRERLHRELT